MFIYYLLYILSSDILYLIQIRDDVCIYVAVYTLTYCLSFEVYSWFVYHNLFMSFEYTFISYLLITRQKHSLIIVRTIILPPIHFEEYPWLRVNTLEPYIFEISLVGVFYCNYTVSVHGLFYIHGQN